MSKDPVFTSLTDKYGNWKGGRIQSSASWKEAKEQVMEKERERAGRVGFTLCPFTVELKHKTDLISFKKYHNRVTCSRVISVEPIDST